MTYSSGCVANPNDSLKTRWVVSATPMMRRDASIHRSRDHARCLVTVRITGPTMSAPIASPNHQSRHRNEKRLQDCTPAAQSVMTPIEALSMELRPAPTIVYATTSLMRRRLWSNCGNRRSVQPAATASSVFPDATTAAVHKGASDRAFAANAPTQTAGHIDTPRRSSAAIPMPVGAQTVLICSATNANLNPTSAAAA